MTTYTYHGEKQEVMQAMLNAGCTKDQMRRVLEELTQIGGLRVDNEPEGWSFVTTGIEVSIGVILKPGYRYSVWGF